MSEEIGRVIRAERQAAKLTQQQLGELSGVGLNFISQLERGKPSVRLDKVLDVLKVLGLELNIIRGTLGVSVSEELSE